MGNLRANRDNHLSNMLNAWLHKDTKNEAPHLLPLGAHYLTAVEGEESTIFTFLSYLSVWTYLSGSQGNHIIELNTSPF